MKLKSLVLLLFFMNLNAQQSVLDSLHLKLNETTTNVARVHLLNELSNNYKYSDPSKMIEYGTQALQLAQADSFKLEEGTAYINIGTGNIILGNYEKALDHFVWAKTVFEGLEATPVTEKKIAEGIAKTYGYMGIVFSEQSSYDKAIQYYLISAKQYETLKDEAQCSKIYNNIGVAYRAKSMDGKALDYFEKAKDIQEKLEDPNTGITLTNIANIYVKQNNLDQAFEYYTEAKQALGLHPNNRALGEWYNNIGAYYLLRKDGSLAQENWNTAIKTFKSIDDSFGLADTYLHLAQFHLDQKNSSKALLMANEALALATKTKVLEQRALSEKLLSAIYNQKGAASKALLHYKQYSSLKDSLSKESDIRKAVEASMNYEFEKKELLQKEENEKREILLQEKVKTTRLQLLFGTLIALLLAGMGLLIYNRNHLKKTLTLQKELAEYEQKALHLQMNPHFVFNCLGSISSFIVQNGTDSAIKYLSKFSKLMRLTLEYSKESLIPIDKEIESLQNYLELEQLRFNNKFKFSINKDLAIEDDVALPPLLIQPFIENAIIHGVIPKKTKGIISINFSVTYTSLNCVIIDDGVGIHQSRKNKENFVLAHKSMALDIIKKRLEMIAEVSGKEATIDIEELTDGTTVNGTKVVLKLPLQYIEN